MAEQVFFLSYDKAKRQEMLKESDLTIHAFFDGLFVVNHYTVTQKTNRHVRTIDCI